MTMTTPAFHYPVLIHLGKILRGKVDAIETEAARIKDVAPVQSVALQEIARQFDELAKELGA